MNKLFLALFSIMLIILWASLVSYFNPENLDSLLEETQGEQIPVPETTQSPEKDVEKTKEEIVKEKIELIRSRHALKWLILEWDSHYSSWDLWLALARYREFYKQNPDDPLVIEKLWDTYMSMHNYESADNYYKKIENNNSDKYIRNLFFLTDFSSEESISALITTIINLSLDEQRQYYYVSSARCALDFHACKKEYNTYFWPEEHQEEESSNSESGSENEIDINQNDTTNKEITYTPLENIKTAIQNYRNFQIDDVSLKNTFIISEWYKQWLYPLVVHISNSHILGEKPDYKPVLKILAESYYEMWNYEQSRKVLSTYNELDSWDPRVVYMLGLVNTKLRDYVLANINYNRSIKLWLEESLLARKQLIHNFYVLGNNENMLREFRELIRTESLYSENDISLALYHHIIHEKYDWALENLPAAKEKFPTFWNLYGYEWWIYREQWDLENARSVLEAWNTLDPENPFILINLGYTYRDLWLRWASLISFKKVISLSPDSEFGQRAEQEIEEL